MKKLLSLVMSVLMVFGIGFGGSMGLTAWAEEAPEKPASISATAISSTQIDVSWASVAGADGYELYSGTSSTPVYSGPNTTYSHSGLTPNTTYSYKVRSYIVLDETSGETVYSDYTDSASILTPPLPVEVPGTPADLKATSLNANSIRLSWKAGSGSIDGYYLERKLSGGSWERIRTITNASTLSFEDTGLSENKTYYYRIQAYNSGGASPYSNEASARTEFVLARPDNLEASSINTDRVTITWRDRSSNERGFIIERKTENGRFTEIARVRANTTSYTDTRLRDNTTYTYRIQAYNDDGRSDYSEELEITTGLVPDRPTNLTITSVSNDRISIEWKDNSDNEKGFKIERRTENGSYSEIATVRANVEVYTNTGLRDRTKYTYRVRAYNDTGNSSYSNEVSAVTGLLPESPDRLTITRETGDQVTLSWRDRSDNEKGFILERKTGTGSFTEIETLPMNTTTYTDSGLKDGQTYTYRVRAYNDSGESGNSNEVTVTRIAEIVTRMTIGNTQYRVDGRLKEMDVAPVIYESRTLLPFRYVAEAIGATVLWNATEEKVTVRLDDTVVELWIGSNIALVNGVATQIDENNHLVKPLILPPGRTMIPLAFVSRSLGCDVEWNEFTREVTVTYPAK